MTITEFIEKFDDFLEWDDKKKVDYLSYYLTSKDKTSTVTSKKIDDTMHSLDIRVYPRTSAYLSEESKSKLGKYNKQQTGYRLEKKNFDEIKMVVENEPRVTAVSQELTSLLSKVKDSQEHSFLTEAINCYRVQAYRASIVMVWTLTIDHILKYIFGQKLSEFNTAISNHSNKKINPIIQYEDFAEIKETTLIELMRSSNIISKDLRKILDEKLGIRNSAAHASGVSFLQPKATEFISDLIDNVLLKF